MLKFGSKSDVTVVHRATIRLLDDAEIIHCDFQPQHKGRYILEYVCKQLNILETDYFGLRYVDHCRQRHWLDLAKTAIKQVKDMDPILFSFRVKFYPPDPLRLKEEITRYQVYQQLKRDLLHGRLYCSPGEAALLAACIVQSELGDYDPKLHEGNYISEHKLLLKQTEAIEEKAMKLHQTELKGFTPQQAETHFLRLASQLDTYAVDPHPVKDQKGAQLYLGINHCGILTFQGSRKTHHFRWPEVQKINYEGKMFIVHLTISEDVRTKKKHTVGFKCPTGSNCRHVWRCAIEQMLFFTLPRASDAPVVSGGSIFSWGTKFKYTGRTEKEVLEETGPLRKEEPPIQRCQTTCLRRKASSVPATPSTPSQDLVEIRYSSLPRSCHSAGLDGAGMSEGSTGVPFSSPYCPDNTLPLLEPVSEDQEIHSRRNNVGQHEGVINDYYFRDSFDHSSSESQLLDASGKPHSRSVTPVPKMQKLQNAKEFHQQQQQQQQQLQQTGRRSKSRHKSLRITRLFIPAFMLTITVLFTVIVLVFETDTTLFNNLRKTPEMVALKNQYYVPIKEFLRTKLGLF
ncbi:FERM domain-containing protein 5 isoform X5 [Apis mellifera]|uniref:FERM domain-containing protein 5 isoform X5 n=1 Tax=Apis mellifera TaxID=7460 RepID=A0A7M7H5H9_APIME|nr:FERM domain-containing protein 5 isoform X5 [Apis mellifera]|eukprot:XP_006572072.1 FERM domain-containing protein 5 isoform X5 [Apis mellifera]